MSDRLNVSPPALAVTAEIPNVRHSSALLEIHRIVYDQTAHFKTNGVEALMT